jgi:protoheme IX farnesyltransferase
MSSPVLVYENRRELLQARFADYLELSKPRIAVLELVVVAVAAYAAGWNPAQPWLLVSTLLGTTLLAASASALNQWLELETDGLMPRTCSRPLPAGRLSSGDVFWFGSITVALGAGVLLACVNLQTAAVGVATWGLYVWVYTPLKSRTVANTAIGAVAGALPVMIGWSSTGNPWGLEAYAWFLILFLWQFPHFMAIAWLYREHYAAAGLKMLAVTDPSGRRAGAQAVLSALALVPVSLVPVVQQLGGGLYFAWTLALGLGQLVCAVAFLLRTNERTARWLLRASLIYLPTLLLLRLVSSLS